MKILVMCGAGASSTFIAQRLRAAAKGEGIDLTVTVAPLPASDSQVPTCDILLVGPHLASSAESLRERVAPAPVVVLPDDVAQDFTGTRTLTLVRSSLDH